MPPNLPVRVESRSVATKSKQARAAEYMRMSADHQKYSIEFQCGVIRAYAVRHNLAVVRTYLDHGKSGLSLHGRTGLQTLLADVESGHADFDTVLVYDVSRWGRFQNIDESAFYEFQCRQAGVRVIYCVEPFDDTPMGGIFKSIKRVMAGEYSRALSVRVWGGQAQAAAAGYRLGGHAGYGLRRLLLGSDGLPKETLVQGELKCLSGDKIILIPGPREEVETVWNIYDWFVFDGKSQADIVAKLNSNNPEGARKWTVHLVYSILTCHKYAGDNIYNRTSRKLRAKVVKNPPELWVRRDNAFRPLVSRELFADAQKLLEHPRGYVNAETMKEMLVDLLKRNGHLSAELIRKDPKVCCPAAFTRRFGGLHQAYEAAGYCTLRPNKYVVHRERISLRARIIEQMSSEFAKRGRSVEWNNAASLLILDGTWSISISMLRRYPHNDVGRWQIKHLDRTVGDEFLLVRSNPKNKGAYDCLLVPASRIGGVPGMALGNSEAIQEFRIADLDGVMRRAGGSPQMQL